LSEHSIFGFALAVQFLCLRLLKHVAPLPRGHYSQAVRIGSWLFISGQLPIDRTGTSVKGKLAEEAAQALENIRAIVEAAEGTIADIVQCTIYISDIGTGPR